MRQTLFCFSCLLALGCGDDQETRPLGGSDGGAASSGQGGSDGSGTGGGTAGAGDDCTHGSAQPLLRYPLDGDPTNLGTLGAGFDGAASSGVAWIAGKIGEAARFQGPACSGGVPAADAHRIDLPGTGALLSDKPTLTIGLWFREDALPETECVTQLIECRSDVGGFESYQGVTPEELTTCATLGSEGKSWCGSLSFSFGDWHHLLYRYDATSNRDGGGAPLDVYLDGKLALTMDNADQLALFPPATNDLVLGRLGFFDIDDVRVFDAVFDEQGNCTEVMGGAWCDGACVPP